jgi:hypothetical protein
MKTLSKLITTAFAGAALFFTTQVNAQTITAQKFALSLGIEAGKPTGGATPYAVFNLGGTVRLQYGLTNDLALTFTTGGYHFFMEDIPGTSTPYNSYGVGPVKAGIKYFFAPNIYFGAEGGIGVEVTEHGFDGGQKKLLLSPAIGYATEHWDYAVHYESLTGQGNNYGIVALRVAYGFKL